MTVKMFFKKLRNCYAAPAVTPLHDNPYAAMLENLQGQIIVTEIYNGADVVDELFERVFGHPAPRHGIHVVTLCRMSDGSYRVANYLNYWFKEGACYIGGLVTDTAVVKHGISTALRKEIRQQGGFAKIAIMHVLDRHRDTAQAFFGHTSVPQVLKIIDTLGFVGTDQECLYVKWAEQVSERHKHELLAQARHVGAF